MPRDSNREVLLQAAVTVASREGAAQLTLDAVAREAGVSKGGLLYHFASKDALLRALLLWELDGFEAALERRIRATPTSSAPGAFLQAYVALSLEALSVRVPVGLLAAYAFGADDLSEVSARLRRWQARACQALPDQAAALTLLLAADGAWLSALLGAPISPAQAQALLTQVNTLIGRGEAP